MSDAALLKRTQELALEFLDTLPHRRVGPAVTVDELRAASAARCRKAARTPLAAIERLARGADPGLVGMAGPRYFGFVIGGHLPAALAADWLTSTWDQNAALYVDAPANSVVEEVAAGWLLEILDLPRTASVGFTTGGMMANFTALAAARHAVLAPAGLGRRGARALRRAGDRRGDRRRGARHDPRRPPDARPRPRAGEAGAGRRPGADGRGGAARGPAVLRRPADRLRAGGEREHRRLRSARRDRRRSPRAPARPGSTSTAPSGSGRAASPALAHLVRGAERADSWATDGHKWLNVPYDCGIVIVDDPEAHRAAMTIAAAYLVQTERRERDPFDYVPEFSRRARGFTVWAALRSLGRSGVADLVERCCALARRFADQLARRARRRDPQRRRPEPGAGPLRARGASGRTPRGRSPASRRDGTCWLGGTTWHGMAAMRISVSNWSTTEADVDLSAAAILRAVGMHSCLRRVHSHRPALPTPHPRPLSGKGSSHGRDLARRASHVLGRRLVALL